MHRGVFSTIIEALGRGLGGILAPLATEASLIRGARVFHPDGDVYIAEVRPLATDGALAAIGERLAGRALVRLSGGLRRYSPLKNKRDVLGIAVRFKGDRPITEAVESGDQDLIFGSFRSLFTIPLAMFTTNAGDFLANTYYGALPFHIAGFGRAELRLVSAGTPTTSRDRREGLAQAAALGLAVFHLEVRRKRPGGAWVPVASIDLTELACVDQERLSFNPFHAARGIRPVGFLQALRAAVYPASQLGRQLATGKIDERLPEAASAVPVTPQKPTLTSHRAS